MEAKPKLFSREWMESWKNSINKNKKYRKEAGNWNEPILFRIDTFPENIEFGQDKTPAGIIAYLKDGKCESVEYAYGSDIELSPIVLYAGTDVWEELIVRKKDPVYYLMTGKLKVDKGNLLKLAAERKAARQLLMSAHYALGLESANRTGSIDSTVAPDEDSRRNFVTTGRGLEMDSFPIRLFQKAKKLGVWDPADIPLEQDRKDWEELTDLEKTVFTHLGSLFIAGEEAVTLDLLPLMKTVASEGRLEEEIYLTSFLWEEAKHTEFFFRYLDSVIGKRPDFNRFHAGAYEKLFYEELPNALKRLDGSPSPENQLKAVITYNMIVEGILAETGYAAYHKMLKERNIMPGMQEAIVLIKRDESRHIAFGLYLLNRLIEDNENLESLLEDEMSRLLNLAIDVINEIFEPYKVMPFGLNREWFLEYAVSQYQNRRRKIAEG